MRKSFCDKCHSDCTNEEREIKCVGSGNHYLYLDGLNGGLIGRDLMLCLSCKLEFEKIIQEWMKK
jgi:hypothetical protein